MVTEWGYVCATSRQFEVLREGSNSTLVPSLCRRSDRALSSVEVRVSNCDCSFLKARAMVRRKKPAKKSVAGAESTGSMQVLKA
jgi:hypothetical protein